MLSNASFLAKFRFDTAENEPAKNLHFSKNAFSKNAFFAAPTGGAELLLREQEGPLRFDAGRRAGLPSRGSEAAPGARARGGSRLRRPAEGSAHVVQGRQAMFFLFG